ncbi:MAG: alkaline phosphatase [Spirochaetales bacterium]|nr:alkaline phosphatase [Spirochaetales bacterium]
MMKLCKKLIIFLSLFIFLSCALAAKPVSVILMIGDGMGFEQIKAADYYFYGEEGRLSFESFPVKGSVTTYSADNDITDSAAAATAMATGQKVNNGVISKAIPGDGSNLVTLLKRAQQDGKSTGIVTTTMVTHATPAAFASHNLSRNNYAEIAADIFTVTKPNVVMGGGGPSAGIVTADVNSAGYNIAQNSTELRGLTGELACGFFGDGHMPYEYDGLGDYPHLNQMAVKALDLLDTSPAGFFLMIEGGRIDHACHSNDLVRAVYEVKEFSDTVQVVLDWMGSRDDVLLIVTADHETGGLSVTSNNGVDVLPTVTWSTDYHTAADVPLYAFGAGSELFSGKMDNTDIYDLILLQAF